LLESLGGNEGNIVGALFQLENSASPQSMDKSLSYLIKWFNKPGQEALKRAFNFWLKRVLLPRKFPGQTFPNTQSLTEVQTMLSKQRDNWTGQWKQEGIGKV